MQEGCCSNDALFWTLPLDRVLALLSAIALVATAFVLYPYHKAVNLFQNPVRWREVAERTPGQSSATPQATAADAEACSSSRDITLAEAAPQALPETDEVLDGGDDASLKNLPEFASGVRSVVFDDGAAYNGEWRNGKMHGRGVFLWPTGDRYEGEWKDGEQDGQGTFAAADGSVYYGGWSHGKMDGEGVYKPGMLAASAAGAHQATVGDVIFLRRYVQGKLMKEVSLRMKDAAQKKQVKESRKKQSLGGRPLQPGEVIYKGHHSYDLMRQLQLGIMYSIAQAGLTAAADLTSKDYTEETVQYFPSSSTGDASAFKYKDYAPKVFHKLRAAFHIDNADYLVSLTGGPALRELPSPGASGCIFFLSSDDRFLIKSVRKEEMALLLGLVKRYYRHVAANPRTLLVHFYGLHRISPWLGRNARFLVMGNVLPSNKRMHRKYDLKGSTYKRTAGKEKMDSEPGATLKDLDIDIKVSSPCSPNQKRGRRLAMTAVGEGSGVGGALGHYGGVFSHAFGFYYLKLCFCGLCSWSWLLLSVSNSWPSSSPTRRSFRAWASSTTLFSWGCIS